MKPFLMYKDQDFDLRRKLPWNEQALIQDLELDTLFNAMALEDKFLLEVARKAVLSSIDDPDTILYRQDILKDCLKHPSLIRDIYAIVVEALEEKKKHFWGFYSKYPAGILSGSIEMMQAYAVVLKKLRTIADEKAEKFESEGFRNLFAMLKKELNDDYFEVVQNHLNRLKFRDGVLISAELGKGNKGVNYVLRELRQLSQSWMDRIITDYILPRIQDSSHPWLKRIFAQRTPAYTFYLHPRDEAGARALTEFRDRGIHLVANALAQSADHIRGFFTMLQT